MAQRVENRSMDDAVELPKENGSDGLAEAMTVLSNSAMVAERSEYLGVAPYECSATAVGYANGFKDKTIRSRLGELTLKVPQTRDGVFAIWCWMRRTIRSVRAGKWLMLWYFWPVVWEPTAKRDVLDCSAARLLGLALRGRGALEGLSLDPERSRPAWRRADRQRMVCILISVLGEIYEHRRVPRQLKRLPVDVLKRYEKWKDIVAISGPQGLRLVRGFNDESLAEDWIGHRSSRLNKQYHVVYKIEKQEIQVDVVSVSAHDYRRK